jgi:hypothetical protein
LPETHSWSREHENACVPLRREPTTLASGMKVTSAKGDYIDGVCSGNILSINILYKTTYRNDQRRRNRNSAIRKWRVVFLSAFKYKGFYTLGYPYRVRGGSMHAHYAWIQNGRIMARQVAALVMAGILLSQLLIASDSWSRIEKLEMRTWVYVHHSGEKYIEGILLGAHASGMTVQSIDQGVVFLKHDLIEQVSVNYSGRRWYSIPLAIGAGVAGGLGGYEIANRTTCSDNKDDGSKARGALIWIPAFGSATATYYLTRDKSGKKTIYSKK